MKKINVNQRTFKKSPKFLKLEEKDNFANRKVRQFYKSCDRNFFLLESEKHVILRDTQFLALKNRISKKFKQTKIYPLFLLNKSFTVRSLGSKLGSGKGKLARKVSIIRKYQKIFPIFSNQSLVKSCILRFLKSVDRIKNAKI